MAQNVVPPVPVPQPPAVIRPATPTGGAGAAIDLSLPAATSTGVSDFGHSKAVGLVINVGGLPVPKAEQSRFSSVLTYGFDAKLWSHESTRFGLRGSRARHAYSLMYTPDATAGTDVLGEESGSASQKSATAVRYENAIGVSMHQAIVVAQRRLQLELHGGETSYTTAWSYERSTTSKIFPQLSAAAYNYGARLMWVPWLENSGDIFGIEAEWLKGTSLTGRVLGLSLGWRWSYHADGIPTSLPNFLLDFYGKVQVGTYKTPNPSSGVQEDIKTNSVLFGTTLSLL